MICNKSEAAGWIVGRCWWVAWKLKKGMPKYVAVLCFSGEKKEVNIKHKWVFVLKSQSVQLNIIWQKHKTLCLMCWEGVFWTMDVVFAVFLSSKIVKVQSHDVHPSTTKYALPHVSIRAQLPSMVFSFPTNHVIPWLFKSFLCQSQKPKQSQDAEKPHRKWSLRDYIPCFTTHRSSPAIPSATFNTW